MIRTDENGKETLKQMRKREADVKDAEIKEACQELAYRLIGEDPLKKLSNANKGIWYMPILNDDDSIEMLAIMKPIDRHILSFASTKIEDEGLYTFLEQCMRECFLQSIEPDQTICTDASKSLIIIDDEYFIPAAMKFNKIMESKRVAFLKR